MLRWRCGLLSMHAPSRLTTGVAHWQKTPGAAHSRKGPCAGLLNPQAYTLTPSGRGPWCLWSKTYLLNPKQKLLDSKATQGIEPKIEPARSRAGMLYPMQHHLPSRRMPNAPCPYTLSILPSSKMRRALLAVGSETGDRAREQVQRVAAARTSQNHRRSVARGRISSIEMAYSGGDRSHTKGHA